MSEFLKNYCASTKDVATSSRKILKDLGYQRRVARKKPIILEVNRMKHIKLAIELKKSFKLRLEIIYVYRQRLTMEKLKL